MTETHPKLAQPATSADHGKAQRYNDDALAMELFMPDAGLGDFYLSGGVLYHGLSGSAVANIPDEGRATIFPMVIGRACTIDHLYCYVTVGGSAGAVMRLFAYTHTNGGPGARLADTGQFAATGTGVLGADVSIVLRRPQIVWLGAVVQGAAGTRPTVAQSDATAQGKQFAIGVGEINQYNQSGLYVDSVSAAPPDPWTSTSAFGAITKVWPRLA